MPYIDSIAKLKFTVASSSFVPSNLSLDIPIDYIVMKKCVTIVATGLFSIMQKKDL